MGTKTVMYTQLQPWSAAGAPPCMESIAGGNVPERITKSYMTPRQHPWRPVMGYENIQVTPLPALGVTNKLMEPVCTPSGMITEGLKFPNLVTGFEKNPTHAARAALYTRYTPYEWVQNALSHYNESDVNRNIAERVRSDAVRLMRMADDKTSADQRDSGRRIGERITDTTYWRNEVATELEKMISELNLLQDTKRAVEKALNDTEVPYHIAQECLYHREHRQGIDLVHDQPEQYLLREIDNLKMAQKKLLDMKNQVVEQIRTNRACQHELETDVKSKESAIAIDNVCHQLNNFSRGINYYGGVEKYDNTLSTPQTWSEHSNRVVTRSQAERARSAQIRLDADNLINAANNEIWSHWNDTNAALSRRTTEVLEAKNKAQMHLHRVMQEIFDIEKSIELLRKAIMDKSNPMKVAQTRLEARSHRKEIELCKDEAQSRLVREVTDLQETVEHLHRKLQEAEAQHQQLLITRSNLEADLHMKVIQEIFDIEKSIELLRKAIMDKSNPMKVAQTRLEARSHRKEIELCKDEAQSRSVREVTDLQEAVEHLHRKLQEAEAQHQQLLITRSNLEADLHMKVNSLFIDREKCLGMRRSFPITANITY